MKQGKKIDKKNYITCLKPHRTVGGDNNKYTTATYNYEMRTFVFFFFLNVCSRKNAKSTDQKDNC